MFKLKGMPYRQTAGLFTTIFVVIILLITIDHFGIIHTYVPEVELVRKSLIFMGLTFAFTLVVFGLRSSLMLDHNSLGCNSIKDAMDDDRETSRTLKIANLFSGKVVNEKHLIGRFVRRTAQAKLKNPRYALELDSFLGLLQDELERPVNMIRFNSKALVDLGLMGTFIGLIVALTTAFAGNDGNFDPSMAGELITGLANGLSIAFLTSLFGLFAGAIVLRYVAFSLQSKVEEIVADIDVQYRTHVNPIVNDEELMVKVIEKMQSLGAQEFLHTERVDDSQDNMPDGGGDDKT